jgi:hypothetical protein
MLPAGTISPTTSREYHPRVWRSNPLKNEVSDGIMSIRVGG